MKIEIELNDPKSCDGCFCLEAESSVGSCYAVNPHLWTRILSRKVPGGHYSDFTFIRPDECIKKYGE
jgi:hypothetical protein